MATYFLAEIFRVTDAQVYKRYVDAARPIVEKHDGAYVLRSEKITPVSGPNRPERIVLIRFPDKQSLMTCFNSREYLEIAPLRESSTESCAFVIEGE